MYNSFFNMGNGESKSSSVSTNENNQTIVNRNQINMLNEQVNEAISKTKIDSSTKCNGSLKEAQALSLAQCEIGGDLNVSNIDFAQRAVVDFKCLQKSKVDNQIAQDILTEVMGQIQSTMDQESINRMASKAEASASAGFASWGTKAQSRSRSDNKFNLSVTNDNTTNIQNVLKNAINIEFEEKDVQDCAAEIFQKQELDLSGCKVGGNVNIEDVSYDQGAKLLGECIQSKGISQKISNLASSALGVVVEAETESRTRVEQEAESTSTSETSGLFDASCGPCSASTGMNSDVLSLSCAGLVCLLVVLGLLALGLWIFTE